ncbi:hypothetical protein PU629_06330 [Pullulanibacillus sp. KACC 23026]|uniref:hypothetical protein n=1 Tax=Pullulanibacillus sp. KACC 23026 TaxID=3028315 RepID=UPI0023AF6F54|nr:hypothetical protein [Pullulanibacillus sp. KACC 23026]WEG13981.1 hypothetical protein PU629_06330 [Pullulanibacillus sp. KACC 23026]
MHPKQICDDMAGRGSPINLENGELYIDNPDNIDPIVLDFVKSYKARIIKYLKGEYSVKEHAVKSTIDKIISFMALKEDNKVINDWLSTDQESLNMIMQLLEMCWENGWTNFSDPISNYENSETDMLCQTIFDRTMTHFKKGVKQHA